MDVIHQRYYKINEILMSSIGQWPRQTRLAGRIFLGILVSICTGQLVPQILAIVKYRHDLGVIIEAVSPFMIYLICVVKLINCMVNSNKISMLLERIGVDWRIWYHDREIMVLHEYAETGRKLTVAYSVVIYSVVIIFVTQPVIPKIIDVLFFNGTEDGVFPIPVYYPGVDQQKHYFTIISCNFVGVTMFLLITIAYDTMFIVFALHGCGLFASLGKKLQQLGIDKISLDDGDMDSEYVATCIDRHNNAIEFAKLMESTYSGCFFFLVGIDMFEISLSTLQITTKTNNDPKDTIRFTFFVAAQLVHLYIQTYIAQLLMDHSTSIRNYIHNGKWYNLSLKAQKLLNLMTMRCNAPCKLTAGKICLMSVETFGVVLKTSMSYFTLLRSMQ